MKLRTLPLLVTLALGLLAAPLTVSVSIVTKVCPTQAHSSSFGRTSKAFLTDAWLPPTLQPSCRS